MSFTHSADTAENASRRIGFLRNPVLLERGLGVLLWVGLLAVLIGKPF
ncbi:MAG: hypothetical protein VX460_00575 [Planctomycetota bacterium]|nr:hypothetical protein [Planctomycetota bacterium]